MPTSHIPLNSYKSGHISKPEKIAQEALRSDDVRNLVASQKLKQGDTLEAKVVQVKPIEPSSSHSNGRSIELGNQSGGSASSHATARRAYQVTLSIGKELVTLKTETPLQKADLIRLMVAKDQQLTLMEVTSSALQREIQPLLRTAIAQQSSISPVIAHLLALKQAPLSQFVPPPAQTITPQMAIDLLVELPKLLHQLANIIPTKSTLLAAHHSIKQLMNTLMQQIHHVSMGSNLQSNASASPLSALEQSTLTLLMKASIKTALEKMIDQVKLTLPEKAQTSDLKNTLANRLNELLTQKLKSKSPFNQEQALENGVRQSSMNRSIQSAINSLLERSERNIKVDPEILKIIQQMANNLGQSTSSKQGQTNLFNADLPLGHSLTQLRITTAKLGQLLERHLSQSINISLRQPMDNEAIKHNLNHDLKANLLQLQALFHRLNQAPTDHLESNGRQSELSQIRALYALALYQGRFSSAGANSQISANIQTPHSLLSFFSNVAPPLSGISFFTRQPQLPLHLKTRTDLSKYSSDMAESIQKALSRLTLTQWQNLHNWTQNRDSATPRVFNFEIPVHDQHQIHTIQCELEKRDITPDKDDSSTNKNDLKKIAIWRIALNFDIEPLGPIFLQLSLHIIESGQQHSQLNSIHGETVKASAQVWAERKTTASQATAQLNTFKDMLTAIGLEVQSVECNEGSPPTRVSGVEHRYVDIKT